MHSGVSRRLPVFALLRINWNPVQFRHSHRANDLIKAARWLKLSDRIMASTFIITELKVQQAAIRPPVLMLVPTIE
jgi:hypothetical protein